MAKRACETRWHESASVALLALVCAGVALPAAASAQWDGSVSSSLRMHGGDALAGSAHGEVDLSVRARATWQWDDRRQSLTVEPFLRLDLLADGRSRLDFRDLSWTRAWNRWALVVGSREVFWGTAESRHLIDEINQREPTATIRGYDKLAQPMLSAKAFMDWGVLEAFLLPFFRPRPFHGRSGRLSSPLPVADETAVFEAGSGRFHPDLAARWSHSLRAWDAGLAFFYGNGRDPRLEQSGDTVWIPHYDVVNRTMIDVQWTASRWLVKAEAVTRGSALSRYSAAVGGVEFAPRDFASVFLEYSYDSRGTEATTAQENDVYVGGRLLTQDGSLQSGLFVDRYSGAALATAEARWRFGADIVLSVEARRFWGEASEQPPRAPHQESFLAIAAERHF
ncbi:MAG: hypothetical protein ABFS34_14200 [Gemmatimonadota bacterium]